MNSNEKFLIEVICNIDNLSFDFDLKKLTNEWIVKTSCYKYTYNFSWFGRPIIQFPQDMIAIQELVWKVKPDLIIETGIAHGGSLFMNASYLALLDYFDAVSNGNFNSLRYPKRRVIGIDIDIRSHNLEAIKNSPLYHRITMIQGSSIDPVVIDKVYQLSKNYSCIMICLDSNHTHEHVLAELEAYGPLTGKNSYCCVFDTIIEDMPDNLYNDRAWDKKNNPKSAVREYLNILKTEGRKGIDGNELLFEVDKYLENKLLITVAPDGYLRRL